MFKRVSIIGLGLIGGSLGLAMKDKGLSNEVFGVSRRKSTIDKARSMGAVDYATKDLKKGIDGSQLIILCAPVLDIIKLTKRIAPLLKQGVILTDAGSTKKDIVEAIEKILPKGVYFVGSHPLAGSEKSGVIYGDKGLFEGARCVVTVTSKTDKSSFNKIKKFWASLGMKVIIMSPDKHDIAISKLSHLPHAASVALCNSSLGQNLSLAAGGFKDTTRIASGSPELWKDIFITNRKNIINDIKVLKKELQKIELALKHSNGREVIRLLRRAKSVRDSIK